KIADVPVTFAATEGELSMHRAGLGVQAGTFTPTARGAEGEAVIAARLRNGRSAMLRIKLTGGIHPRVTLMAPLRELPSDGLASMEIAIRVTDDEGHGLDRQKLNLYALRGVVGAITEKGGGNYV